MFFKSVKAGLVAMKIPVMVAALLFMVHQTAFSQQCTEDGDCDDGQYCTGVETCDNQECSTFDYFTDYPCRGSEQDLDCVEGGDSYICQPATLTVGDASGSPGSSTRPVEVSLANSFSGVKTVTLSICDEDDYLSCSGCQATNRAEGFSCNAAEVNGCCKILLYSTPGGIIAPGSSPVLRVNFDVSSSAPQNGCRGLAAENLEVGNEFNAELATDAVAGEFCFSSTPTTSTTSSSTSTTTSVQPSYTVTITPAAVTVSSGATVQFTAKTTLGDEETAGTYTWLITPASAIGSAIDGSGLFTAGTASADRVETVEVTDTANGNVQATARVTVKKSEEPEECEVLLSPLAATVLPGETLTLTAGPAGDCEEPRYEWSLVSSDTDSSVEPVGATCLYTAGTNDGTEYLLDIVRVVDTVNGVEADVEITIPAEGISVRIVGDAVLRKSPWIPLPYLLVLQGQGTHFAPFKTRLSFSPERAVVPLFLFPLVLRDQYIWDLVMVLPSIVAGEGDQPVTVTVTTGSEVVADDVLLQELRLTQARGLR